MNPTLDPSTTRMMRNKDTTMTKIHCKPTALRHAGTVALAAAISTLLAGQALASSHREGPFITQFPKVDGTDFYAFNSYESGREDYVTLIANYIPLQDAYGGPNYFSLDNTALYEIHIENTGDAVEDLTFQFRVSETLGGENGTGAELMIGDQSVGVPLKAIGPISADSLAGANVTETYEVSMVAGDRRSGDHSDVTGSAGGTFTKPLDYIGEKTFGNAEAYEAYVASQSNASGNPYNDVTFEGCPSGAQDGRVFVGQRKDSFSINLGRIFDLVNLNPLADVADEDAGNDDLADKNITTLAVEVHKDCLTGGNTTGVIGAWTTASKQQVSVLNPHAGFNSGSVEGGAWTQLSRLGSPLVNEVVIGINDKNRFNASEPKDDGQFATYVTNPTLPAILNLLFNSEGELTMDADVSIAPAVPRNDLVAAFLTGVAGVNQISEMPTPSEMLRLNTGVAATPMGDQVNLGVAGGDLAGFPNGRRPGDDITDIALRAVLGAFCHQLPFDANADGTVDKKDNLLLCGDTPEDAMAAAPAGTAPVNDGVPQNAGQFDDAFPYLTTPLAGATNE